MNRDTRFISLVVSLWSRLITLAIVSFTFYEALYLARGKAQGWSFYLTGWELAFEVVVRLVAASLAGLLVGTAAICCFALLLWCFRSWQEQLADWTIKCLVVLAVFVIGRYAFICMIEWATHSSSQPVTYVKVSLLAFYVAFGLALCIGRVRNQLVTSLDGVLTEKMTRRTALVTIAGGAGLIAAEYAWSKRLATVKAALPTFRPKSNILLISFDALSAEDMSLYGRALPTTPNIDAFARTATVFTKFFSASTFTTPAIAAILTGGYPSESRVYQLQGQLRREDSERNVVHLLRDAGYGTGAFVSNPFAYYFMKGLERDFDVLPQPIFQEGGLQQLWMATAPLHQDSGIGSRVEEFMDLGKLWNYGGRMPSDLMFRLRPAASFQQARQALAELPSGFFLWVHVMAPHSPYLPDAPERGRFLPASEMLAPEETFWNRSKGHYEADQQRYADQWRLRYDESIATADRAFGDFVSELERSGKLRDTTVIVTADHGESFEGGVYQHRSRYQTRPVIHIPLIIKMPEQQEGHAVAYTADQTMLAPTILELAGLPKPQWMRSQSLAPWLNRYDHGECVGLAFTQYLETNSVFKPLRHGSVGAIQGDYQYVVHLENLKGVLRPLNEAQIWDLDRSAESPERAAALLAMIQMRFPDLMP